MSHFRSQCIHGVLVSQCRCPHRDKQVRIVPCPSTCHEPQPPAPSPAAEPPDGHEHRWTAWRRIVVSFDSLGNEIGGRIIAEVTDPPVTSGFTRQCACGELEVSGLRHAEADRAAVERVRLYADLLDDDLRAKGFRLDRCIPPGDAIRAVLDGTP
jgi:hypothetical protein